MVRRKQVKTWKKTERKGEKTCGKEQQEVCFNFKQQRLVSVLKEQSHQQPESTTKKRESVRPFPYTIANLSHRHFTDPFGKQAFWG